jgi:enoyl-CoA hydratase
MATVQTPSGRDQGADAALIDRLLAGGGERIGIEVSGGVLLMVIQRPHIRNAIDRLAAQELAGAVDYLEQTPGLRVAIITGQGSSFCSGMDLRGFASGDVPGNESRGFAGLARRPPTKPLIAAVEGYALAGGFEIVLACDLVTAASDAKFGLPEVRRGLVAAGGGLLRLPRRLPYNVAMELVLTGDLLAARRAHELGLVNRLVEPGEALGEAQRMARSISANAPLAVQASKRIVTESADWTTADAFERQASLATPVLRSDDAIEGAKAFTEKRPPIWRGR